MVLPPEFDGHRIAQLSDLHVGSFCPRERAVGWSRLASSLDPDLVVFTGDYVGASGGPPTRVHGDR